MSKGTNSNFPRARTADLITERVGDELVVYDGESSEAHCLSALASAVFLAADGNTSPADLAAIAGKQLGDPVDVPAVQQALVELEDRGLVEVGGISRRGFMQRSAAVGGAAFAATMVTSVVAPSFGMATSDKGVPSGGWSSMAIEFQGCTDNKYYGAHWDQTASNLNTGTAVAPTGWSAKQANAMCVLPNASADKVDGTPTDGGQVFATATTDGLLITVPASLKIDYVAVWFGNGGLGSCNGCLTSAAGGGLTLTKTTGGYYINFPLNCY